MEAAETKQWVSAVGLLCSFSCYLSHQVFSRCRSISFALCLTQAVRESAFPLSELRCNSILAVQFCAFLVTRMEIRSSWREIIIGCLWLGFWSNGWVESFFILKMRGFSKSALHAGMLWRHVQWCVFALKNLRFSSYPSTYLFNSHVFKIITWKQMFIDRKSLIWLWLNLFLSSKPDESFSCHFGEVTEELRRVLPK